jgi:hypothetical protein
MKMNKIGVLIIVILGVISAVNGHGVPLQDNVFVIADETTGITAKKLIDDLNLDIKVYEFSSEGDVYHELEHTINNEDKKILLVSFQDTGNEFLKEHPELANQVIVCNDTSEKSIKESLIQLNSTSDGKNDVVNFNIDYTSLILVIIVIGLISTIGILFLKKKK